ncbi:hypothetical protein RRSWK_02865 [Rhodopirellula sp. SWK7]|nr:hypothetical protein RRSWK_02865 [Rhodopirellula sp. SWK7]
MEESGRDWRRRIDQTRQIKSAAVYVTRLVGLDHRKPAVDRQVDSSKPDDRFARWFTDTELR